MDFSSRLFKHFIYITSLVRVMGRLTPANWLLDKYSRHKQPFIRTFTPTGNLASLMSLARTSLNCGRRLSVHRKLKGSNTPVDSNLQRTC